MLAVSARIKADICTDWMHGTGCVKTRLQSDPCDFVRRLDVPDRHSAPHGLTSPRLAAPLRLVGGDRNRIAGRKSVRKRLIEKLIEMRPAVEISVGGCLPVFRRVGRRSITPLCVLMVRG